MLEISDSIFFGIEELVDEWCVCYSKLRKWLVEGRLRSHVFIPVLTVYTVSGREKSATQLEHFQGFVPVTKESCLRLFRYGELTIREFQSFCGECFYRLPDSSQDIRTCIDDLVVLGSERERFEAEFNLQEPDEGNLCNPISAGDFASLRCDREIHYFGEKQAHVLHALYAASKSDNPWVSGKQLLYQAGSRCFTLSNLFKHKPVWRQIIESNRKGSYRMKMDSWCFDILGDYDAKNRSFSL